MCFEGRRFAEQEIHIILSKVNFELIFIKLLKSERVLTCESLLIVVVVYK